jgi:hypothetical protein
LATEIPNDQDKAVEQVVRRLNLAQQRQNPDFRRFDRYYKLFRSYIPDGRWPWRSKIFVPYAFSTVITVLSKMVANDPTIEFAPRPKDEDPDQKVVEKAKLLSKLFSYQWSNAKGFAKLVDWVLITLIFGKGVVKIYWRYEKDEVKYNKYGVLGRKSVGVRNKVLFDGPDFDVVDPLDLFIDPQAKKVEDAVWIIHRTYPTLEELKDMKDSNGDPLYTLPSDEELTNSKLDPFYNEGMGNFKQRRARVTGPVPSIKDTTVDRLELLEHWTNGEVVTVANQSYIVRREENPFWDNKHPFVEMVDTPLPFDFYKIGTIEPIERLQHALNDIKNQRMDNVNLNLNRMWKLSKTADVDEYELVSRPGGIIHTGDMAGIEPIETPDVTNSSYTEEENIKYDIQQATGVSDYYAKGVGGDSVTNRTATGAKLVVEETNTRVKFKMKYLDDALQALGTKWHARNEQFIDSDQVLRITGASGTKFVKLSPQDIQGDYDIIAVSGSTEPLNKQAQTTQYLNWFQQLLSSYAVWGRQVQVDWHEVITEFSDKFGITNLERIFPAARAPLQPGATKGGNTGIIPAEQPDMTPAESLPQGMVPPEQANETQAATGAPGAQIMGGGDEQEQEKKPDSVSIPGNSAVGIEVLLNRGEITPEQADQLHQIVSLPQAQQPLHKAALDAQKVQQKGQIDVLQQKHNATKLEVESAQTHRDSQLAHEQALVPHRVGIMQTLLSRIGLGGKNGQEPPNGNSQS